MNMIFLFGILIKFTLSFTLIFANHDIFPNYKILVDDISNNYDNESIFFYEFIL